MSGRIVLISERDDDRKFFAELASEAALEFHNPPILTDLKGMLQIFGNPGESFVFWATDVGTAADSIPRQEMAETLSKSIGSEFVFMVSDQPIYELDHLTQSFFYSHHLTRKFDAKLAVLLKRFFKAGEGNRWINLHDFLSEGAPQSQPLTLISSTHRKAACDAVQNVLSKRGVNPRISSLIAQGVDELLMNSIFDAPRKSDGKPYRNYVPRTDVFYLDDKERVTLEMGFTETHFTFSVTDQFGSLDRKIVQRFIKKDYSGTEYVVREDKSGAGLGVYGLIQTGVSLIYVVKPGVMTRAILYVPLVNSYKEYRSTFQFISFIFL